MFNFAEHPHRRLNPLSGEWVLVSPHRTKRPWQGQVEKLPPEQLPAYDSQCYLCPGNPRAGGVRNPEYTSTFVFENDFAALLRDTPPGSYERGGLLRAESERGSSRVVCFSPRHDLTLGRMEPAQIRAVVDTWVEESVSLAAREGTGYVQIFENRGEMMGCSNPHPHCQIWATEHLPNEIEKEQRTQRDYLSRHGRSLLGDYLALELETGERLVDGNGGFAALVPFWAVWPFELLVIARQPVARLEELDSAGRDALAALLGRLTAAYDRLFDVSFPYSMGIHAAPVGGAHPEWRLHLHFYPPLLRSATVRKFMVGFELLAMPQRDITAEAAAARLRECLA